MKSQNASSARARHLSTRLDLAPPPLLTGAALAFWGLTTGQVGAGLIAAVLLELSWILPRLRFEFTERAYVSAWRLGASVFLAIAAVTIFLGTTPLQVYELYRWFPMFFVPVDLVMRFGTRELIPVNTFSYFARRKMLADRAEGQEVKPLMIHTGYVMIGLCIISASLVRVGVFAHFISILSLIVLSLLSLNRRQRRLVPLASTILIIGVSAWHIREPLFQYASFMANRGMGGGDEQNDGSEVRTQIGELRDLKLSREVHWRATFDGAAPPVLLQQAVFNYYAIGRWSHRPPPSESGERQSVNDDYEVATQVPDTEVLLLRYEDEDVDKRFDGLPVVTLQGKVGTTTAIPLPPKPIAACDISESSVTALSYEGFLLESNSLGTVRAVNTPSGVFRGTFYHGTEQRGAQEPWDRDLRIPNSEKPVVYDLVEKLDLNGLPPREQINRLRQYFVDEFRYTTHLSRRQQRHNPRAMSTMKAFLEEDKQGHCEYFATATVLALRALDIPARYCIGFAVREREPGTDTYLLRGTHAHAWASAYIGGEWIAVDLTPPGWLGLDSTVAQDPSRFAQWLAKTAEDFAVWRFRAANDGTIARLSLIGVGVLLCYLLIRLLGVKRASLDDRSRLLGKHLPKHERGLLILVPRFEKLLGPKPRGQTLRQWVSPLLADHAALVRALPLHERLRHDPVGLDEEGSERLSTQIAELKRSLK